MNNTKSETREFWIDISDCEDDDALPSIAYVEHPKQGPLPWQEKLVHVIQFSAYEDLKTKHERVLQALEIAEKSLERIANSDAVSCLKSDTYCCWCVAENALAQIESLKK